VEQRSPGTFGAFNFVVDESRAAGTNSSSGSASLQSSISNHWFAANATVQSAAQSNEATSNHGLQNGNGLAEFSVTFQVLDPSLFTLDGSVALEQIAGVPGGSALVTLRTSSPFGAGLQLSFGRSSGFGSFSQLIVISGLLEPNTYTLRGFVNSKSNVFSAGTSVAGSGSFNLNFGLHPVPLPAAAWLFAAALGILVRFRRKYL